MFRANLNNKRMALEFDIFPTFVGDYYHPSPSCTVTGDAFPLGVYQICSRKHK